MATDNAMTLTFRCQPALLDILPPPIPAIEGLPQWLKAMPQTAFNPIGQSDAQTVKRCPPFIDAMTAGFLIPLPCDVKFENGEFSWDFELPPGKEGGHQRSPIGFHDPSQAVGSPFFSDDRFIIKFNNFWTIQSPPGYSLLFTHPANRADLPFTTLTGLIDCDLYYDSYVQFPALWHDTSFSGTLPKGTPVAQCMPIRRESWEAQIGVMSEVEAQRLYDLSVALGKETGIYRQQFRAKHR